MKSSARSAAHDSRPVDATVIQRRAAHPAQSVWVGASAGSGKTKVLTDRVLRLLLPGEDGSPGTAPHKILCLTFTQVAAREMQSKVMRALSRWAIAPEAVLKQQLAELLGHPPRANEISAARRLFAEVIDAPGSLQIMTIHSFCHSVLSRFPLEAGLPVNFKLVQEREAAGLLLQARNAVLLQADHEKTSPLAEAARRIGGTINDNQFFELLEIISARRTRLETLFERNFGPGGLYARLCKDLNLTPGQTPDDIRLDACRNESFDDKALSAAAKNLGTGTKSDQDLAATLRNWLGMPADKRQIGFEHYASKFLTQKNEPRKNIVSKNFSGAHPEATAVIHAEATRLLELKDRENAAACALLTRDLLMLGEAVLAHYGTLKHERAVLDFDDLIQRTATLLQQGNMAGWVMYKLDRGINHILVDEAQDTNPDQWQVIEALSAEFSSGKGAGDKSRTVFVVGDEKQSIYSFQRASPDEFRRMHQYLEDRFRRAGQEWETVPMNISFRSTTSVLQAVDAVFASPAMREGVTQRDIEHTSHRAGQAGLVELWPLIKTDEAEETNPWDPPVTVIESKSAAAQLADSIAAKIAGWIDTEYLPAHGRTMRPGDILILVRTRNAFFNQLAMALKKRGVPVSGVDRMILNDQIAVQDLLALAEFALLPSDDLSLAAILKSPLIGWSEEQLYALAVDRPGSLWDALCTGAGQYAAEQKYLGNFIASAGSSGPFEFFNMILQQPCVADPVSGLRAMTARLGSETLDPLDELLNIALEFESANIPSLQMFLHWQARESSDIKREMEEPKGEVRIMTVHGAKGLQAPVVIMPDTIRTAGGTRSDQKLFWPGEETLSAPLWVPRSKLSFRASEAFAAKMEAAQEEEYRRLLYVAMTRAADRLYIGGYEGKTKARPQSWYFMMEAGLLALEDAETLPGGALRISNPQAAGKKPDKAGPEARTLHEHEPPPGWLMQAAPAEAAAGRFIAPSLTPDLTSDAETSVFSPLGNQGTYRFRRGTLTHTLLQYLPGLSDDRRDQAAAAFVEKFGGDLPTTIRGDIVSETLAVLRRPDFAAIFGPESLAEVPVTGRLPDGRVISGQIDRLLVTDQEILIVDYKTNRPPPKNPADIPPAYRRQMELYAAVLAGIYPGRAIRCALLWTDGPFLMPLP